jgi:hypothetical protein
MLCRDFLPTVVVLSLTGCIELAIDFPDLGADIQQSDGAEVDAKAVAPWPASDGSAPFQHAEIYAHTAEQLYHFDPTTQKLKLVGAFDCLSEVNTSATEEGMTDIAVDADGRMLGVALSEASEGKPVLVEIDRETAACKVVVELSQQLQGLSFVPGGLLDPEKEVLVGIWASCQYHRVDQQTGQVTKLGTITEPCLSKGGDLVAIKGDATYTTAITDEAQNTDNLLIFNPATAALESNRGDTKLQGVNAGLAYWGGTLYGFTLAGQIVEINRLSAQLKVVAEFPDLSFRGAGVRTTAPIVY